MVMLLRWIMALGMSGVFISPDDSNDANSIRIIFTEALATTRTQPASPDSLLQISTMSGSPGNLDLPISSILVSNEEAMRRIHSPSNLDVPHQPQARQTSNTQYEFIMHTGVESTVAVKRQLKIVRRHVMRNYLHQQHNRTEPGEPLEKASRKIKQRTRQSRSTSFEDAQDMPQNASSSAPARHNLETNQPTSKFYFLGPVFEINLEDANESREYESFLFMCESLCLVET